jgi:carboxylesterase type B
MISDTSKNLFQRAILFSGSAFDPWAFPPSTNFAEGLGKVLGFNGTTEAQLLDFLEQVPAQQLVMGRYSLASQGGIYGLFDIVIGPVVEPLWSETPFLTKDPVVAARTAWSNSIDAIFMTNSFEGLFQAFLEYLGDVNSIITFFNSNSANFAPLVALKLDPSSSQAMTYGQKIKDLYFDGSTGFTIDTLPQYYKVSFERC